MQKRIHTLALALLVASAATAQTDLSHGRGRIENVTDYSQPVVSKTRRVGTRATAPLPAAGSPNVPVILVQFSDLPFTVEATDSAVHANYHKFFNGTGIKGQQYQVPGGIWGSVTDYFIEQSDSLFQPQFTIIGPVTLSRSYTYYGKDRGNSHDVNISQFYSEACKLAMSDANIQWSDFDNNSDGLVDLVFFIYAGVGQNESTNDDTNTIWPKESVSEISVEVGGNTVTFGAYGCTCELYRQAQDGIGTVCHELSHGLGLPDLYDTTLHAFGMDYWDVMDSGCYQLDGKQPCGYSAYERDFMGWRLLETIESGTQTTLTLHPLQQGGTAYVVKNDGQPSGNEYFILENRQNIGFDTYLGCPLSTTAHTYGSCHGLLVTHIDYLASAWTSNTVNTNASHQRMSPVPADGILISYLDERGDAYFKSLHGDLYPGNQNVTELSSYQVFTGTFTQKITNITENADGTITLDINGGSPNAISSLTSVEDMPTQCYTLSGQRISTPQKGINIIRTHGRVKKVFIK